MILNTVFISHATSHLYFPAYDDELTISTVTGPFPSIFFAVYIVFTWFIYIMALNK